MAKRFFVPFLVVVLSITIALFSYNKDKKKYRTKNNRSAVSRLNEGYGKIEPGDFFDNFYDIEIDKTKWHLADRSWGRGNGGVIPDLVNLNGHGVCILKGHGDQYDGPVWGYGQKERVGACLVTKEFFGSGRYEVKAKVFPRIGACTAFWTFFYKEYYKSSSEFDYYRKLGYIDHGGYVIINHEIDIEIPGRPDALNNFNRDISFNLALCNNWKGIHQSEHTVTTSDWGMDARGKYHIYRFDWHTGGDDEIARVDFYFDNKLIRTITTHIPTFKSQYWVGVWFPDGWAGVPDFNIAYLQIDWIKIHPFNEPNDEVLHLKGDSFHK